MNTAAIGVGSAGARLVDQLVHLQSKTLPLVTDALILESSNYVLETLSAVADDCIVEELSRSPRFNGEHTAGRLKQSREALKRPRVQNKIDTFIEELDNEIDAILLFGHLGGGLGAGGMSALLRRISGHNPKLPIYAVGILPNKQALGKKHAITASVVDDIHTMTNNLILVDNTELGVASPEIKEGMSEQDFQNHIKTANAQILKPILFTLTTDDTGNITTAALQAKLNTGTISTIGYVREDIPGPAQPGFIGALKEATTVLRHRLTPSIEDSEIGLEKTDPEKNNDELTIEVPKHKDILEKLFNQKEYLIEDSVHQNAETAIAVAVTADQYPQPPTNELYNRLSDIVNSNESPETHTSLSTQTLNARGIGVATILTSIPTPDCIKQDGRIRKKGKHYLQQQNSEQSRYEEPRTRRQSMN